MANFNQVVLAGNLTRDPELRYTPSGTAVADLRLAVNTPYKGKSGQVEENTLFIDVTVWGRQAELVAQYLKKGRQVLIDGRLDYEEWEAKDGGGKRSRHRVTANRVQFLGAPQGDGAAAESKELATAAASTEDVPF